MDDDECEWASYFYASAIITYNACCFWWICGA